MTGTITYLQHHSTALSGNPLGDPADRRLPVYLPEGYDPARGQPYPVIWVLAPFTSWGARYFNLQAWDENILQIMDRLTASGEASPAILAFPDCFTRLGGSQYMDSSAVGAYETYLIAELIPFLEGHLHTGGSTSRRGIMGYSSGGYAALRLAMTRPGLFSAVACHSGDMFFDVCYRPDFPVAIRVLEQTGGVGPFIAQIGSERAPGYDWMSALNIVAMSACYSPDEHEEAGFALPFDRYTGALRHSVWERWLRQDPVQMIEQSPCQGALRGLKALYFDCGLQDEYGLFLGARMLHQKLEHLGIRHIHEEHHGTHRNINWRYAASLPVLTRALSLQD